MNPEEACRVYKPLTYCRKNLRPAGDISFNNGGLINGQYARGALPYDARLRRHYFRIMKDEGLIDGHDVDDIDLIFSFSITDKGDAFLVENNLWNRQLSQLPGNALTILISVGSALLIAWIKSLLWPASPP